MVTAPAGCEGSIRYSRPGVSCAVTKTFPIATSTASAPVAPVQFSRSLPSPAADPRHGPVPLLATQRSKPSVWTAIGLLPTAVSPR